MTTRVTVERAARATIARLEPDWRDLASRCLEPSIFNEPGFAIAALENLPEARGALLVAAWDDDKAGAARLLGLCMVDGCFRYRAPFPASAWLHLQATAAFPLLDRDRASVALDGILEAVARLPGRPAGFLVHGLPLAGPTARLLGERRHHILDSRTRAILPAGTTGLFTGKDRKELRRLWNRLAERGALAVVVTQTPEEVEQAFQRFLRLESEGWKGRRSTALDSRTDLAAFGRGSIRALATEGLCTLHELRLEGQILASGIVLRCHDRAFFWKTAFDESYRHFSPGVLIALRLSETAAADQSVAVTDSCAVPGHSMIDRVWRDRMLVADVCVESDPKRRLAFSLCVGTETAFRFIRGGLKTARRRIAGAILTKP